VRPAALVMAALLPLAGCSGVNLGPLSTEDVVKAGSAVAASQREFTPEEEQQLGRVVAARVLGTGWFVPVFILDFLKGFAPVFWLAPWVARTWTCDH